jgi:outer membrane protein TolC
MRFVRQLCPALVAVFIASAPVAAADVFPLADDPVLTGLVGEALAKSPELRMASEAAAAAGARVRQVSALPDPTLTIGYANGGHGWAPGSDDDTGVGVAFTQALPYPGKRALAEQVLSREAQEANHLTHRARLDLVYRVRRAWADLLLARENLTLVADQQRATRDIEELTRSRYAVGLAGQSDVLRAQAELARLDQMRFHELGEEESATAELNRLLVRPAGTLAPEGPRLGVLDPKAVRVPDRDELLAGLDETTPVVAAGTARVDRSLAALALARRDLRPDFMAGASYLNRGSLPGMFTIDVGIVAPFYKGRKQKLAVTEAEARLRSDEAARDAMRGRARATAERGLADFRASVLEARTYAQGVLTVDALAVESAIASFQAGKAPFVTVLEAHNALYRDRWQYTDLLFHVLWHSAVLDARMAGE